MPSVISATAGSPLDKVPDLSSQLPKLTPRRASKQDEQPAQPRPETPLLVPPPPLEDDLQYRSPSRRILSKRDHDIFLASSSRDLIVSFVFTLSESVEDISITTVDTQSHAPVIKSLLHILDEAEATLIETPPLDTGSRFGNPAFRDYLDKLESRLPTWHDKLGITKAAQVEVSTYLQHSFGNRSRIDYGSGHELNFIVWLLCLNRLSLLPQSSFQQLVLVVFPRYMRLVRSIQTKYYLEPAGSHGVWGLDDYQFLPFLFGASQLRHHRHLRPMSIHQNMILEQFSKEYLYLDQVAFVNSVKNVEGLRWHSPMLDDISSAKNWIKVEAGMRRMFLAEVLGKLPVMQHFLFGSIIPAAEGMSEEQDGGIESGLDGQSIVDENGMKHVHAETGWGDCCGIPVPSSIGAAQEMKKQGDQGLRRLPFD